MKIAFTMLLFSSSLFASVRMYDGKKSGEFSADCLSQAKQVAAIVSGLPHEKDWTYVVVCTRSAWEDVRNAAHDHGTDWAFTSLADRKTFLNGTMFARASELPLSVTPEFVIAHELGHIALQSDSEDAANKWAREQLKQVQIAKENQ